MEALERRDLLAVVVDPITPTEGVLFNGRVAVFNAGDVQGTLADFSATIEWGTGATSPGRIVASPNGVFEVRGFTTYPENELVTATVRVIGSNGSMAEGTGPVVVQATVPTVTANNLVATAGVPLAATVATIRDANTLELVGNFSAVITWETGRTSQGTIVSNANGGFDVVGTYTYATAGTKPLQVRVFERNVLIPIDSSASIIVSQITTPIVATPIAFDAQAGTIFDGAVATFSDGTNLAAASAYGAEIAWASGTPAEPGLVVKTGSGYEVRGSNIFATSGTFPVGVKVTRIADGVSTSVESQARVSAAQAFVPLTGRIESGSDLGPSSTDGITSISRPVFVGTASPFAVVQLYVQRAGAEGPVPIGRAVAATNGAWQTRTDTLADGVYQIVARQAVPGSAPGELVPLQGVTIDTVASRVTSVAYLPRSRQVKVVFSDNLSGLYGPSVLAAGNYNFIGPSLRRVQAPQAPKLVASGVISQDPEAVAVSLPSATPTRRPGVLRILSGGVIDLAGNPLAGNEPGRSSGNFLASLSGHVRSTRLSARFASLAGAVRPNR